VKAHAIIHHAVAAAIVLLLLVAGEAEERSKSDLFDIETLTEAIRVNPKNIAALINRAAIYAARGQNDYALDDFNAAIWIAKDTPVHSMIVAQAYNGRGSVLLMKSEYDKAIDDFTEALKGDLISKDAYRGRAEALLGQGRLSEALADVNRALWIQPFYADAYRIRARIYGLLGRVSDAAVDNAHAVALPTALRSFTARPTKGLRQLYWSAPEKCVETDKYLLQIAISRGEVTVHPFYAGTEADIRFWLDTEGIMLRLGKEGCRIDVEVGGNVNQASHTARKVADAQRINLSQSTEPQFYSRVFYSEPFRACADSKLIIRWYWGFVEFYENYSASESKGRPLGGLWWQYGGEGCSISVRISKVD
jgi:tetratricopeptide (TPR) repeat protein